jgi:hypothetical protein
MAAAIQRTPKATVTTSSGILRPRVRGWSDDLQRRLTTPHKLQAAARSASHPGTRVSVPGADRWPLPDSLIR